MTNPQSIAPIFSIVLLLITAVLSPSCTTVPAQNGGSRLAFLNSPEAKAAAEAKARQEAEAAAKAEQMKNRAPSGHYLFIDDDVLAALTPSESKIDINLTKQRARILDGQGRLAIETQISTGTSNHRTPTGNFKILEKIVDKSSNRYGRWVHASTGSTITSDGDSYKKPSGNARFVGTKMPYWMRVTWFGIGMHIGYVPDYAASHGCIRVPSHIQPTIYEKTRVGTPVHIHY
jgi:lipoprotein-anchoring transpeptidase ErfK/SrfK